MRTTSSPSATPTAADATAYAAPLVCDILHFLRAAALAKPPDPQARLFADHLLSTDRLIAVMLKINECAPLLHCQTVNLVSGEPTVDPVTACNSTL